MSKASIKVSIVSRSKSIFKNESKICFTEIQEPYQLEKVMKPTHWPSRYKNGISLVNLRKEVSKPKKLPSVVLVDNKLEKSWNLRFATESPEYVPYQKKLNKGLHETKSYSSNSWIELPKTKVQISLFGKALKILKNPPERPIHFKAFSDYFKKPRTRLESFNNPRIQSKGKLEPWDCSFTVPK